MIMVTSHLKLISSLIVKYGQPTMMPLDLNVDFIMSQRCIIDRRWGMAREGYKVILRVGCCNDVA